MNVIALLTFCAGFGLSPSAWADAPSASAKAVPAPPYWDLLVKEAGQQNLPADIADAVVAIESGYDPTRIGNVGEIGLMQVRPETAQMMGFQGSDAQLATPEVNIHYGVTYLAGAWRQTGGDLCQALMKYRSGYGQTIMTPLSATYCRRAAAHLFARHSPFAPSDASLISASVEADAPLPRPSAGGGRPRVRTAATSAAFWARKMAHVQAVSKRIEMKWRRLASR